MRRALVLAGGGGKGAYQFGALLALKSAGVVFDVVAGSSVGALNGYLWTVDALDIGLDFWWNVKPTQVLGLKFSSFLALVAYPIYFVSLMFGEYIGGPQKAGEGLLFRMICWFIGLIFLIVRGVWPLFHHGVAMFHGWSDGRWISTILSCIGIMIVIPFLARKLELSLFSRGKLAHLVQELAKRKKFTNRLLVTVTEKKNTFDPDWPYLVTHRHRQVAFNNTRDFARYVDVCGMYFEEDRRDVLLASSALPFGVFPAVHIGSAEYVDGGISDNLPVYAALSEEATVDEVIVVHLKPASPGILQKTWSNADRLVRLGKLTQVEAREMRSSYLGGQDKTTLLWPPQILPLRDPPYWPSKTIEIAPADVLGNLFTGTLNFSKTRTRQLISMGWADAQRAMDIEENAITPFDPSSVLAGLVERA